MDRHEDEDVVSDRNTYVTLFFKDEIYEECWVQITRRKYDELRVKHLINEVKVKEEKVAREDIVAKMAAFIEDKQVHHYVENGTNMVELHVDAVYGYDKNDTTNKHLPPLKPMGGNRSVRLECGGKTRLCFGQDEAIFRSSQLNDSCWTIDGETTLRTKGLGVGIMVSAMVSRAFGFGMDISKDNILEINKLREGKQYKDEDAATYLLGSSLKKPLDGSPFVRYLNYGQGKDGYWTYKHMILQIEDCGDCLTYLYPDHDYEFELDHSSGHNAERPDGLSTSSTVLNLGWGGNKER